ncbi:MAG TPA: ABC transporter ATP-binding protein [Candidatus Limnocylindrales bacterium]|nr:ABC transporter ATP-binding protein [Candidatus Limnocylindrales bacterium]
MTTTTLRQPKTELGLDRTAAEAELPTNPVAAASGRSIEAAVPALLVEGVTKRFVVGRRKRPVTAIANVSLRLERGGTIGILGANGSGKSTLIRLVSGLLTLDEGRVEVFGHDLVREEMAVKRLINRVSVDAAFFKKLSPTENLLFAARLYGIDAGLARRQTVAICERLGIARKRLGRPVEQMSRGMQQKVAIARALLTSPALLLLDEPTTGLDPRSKLDVQAFIEDIRTSHDASIVLTTHDLEEADRLCERIAVLDDGRAVVQDTPDGLKRLVAAQGLPPTLHSVFMTYTGRSLDEDVEEEDGGNDDD